MKIAQPTPGDFLKTQRPAIEAAAKQANLTGMERGYLNNALLKAKPTSPAEVEALLKDPRALVTNYQAEQAKKQAPKVAAPQAPSPAAPASAVPEMGM